MLCYYPHKNSKVVLDPFKSDFGISFILVLIKKKKEWKQKFLRSSKAKVCNPVLFYFYCDGFFIFKGSNKLKFEGRSVN